MGDRILAGEESEWKEGGVKCLSWGEDRIAVFRTDEGWFAIEDRCTHAEVRLSDGWLDGACVACPWHGAQFDLRTGEALSAPAILPVKTFPVSLEDGNVWLSRD